MTRAIYCVFLFLLACSAKESKESKEEQTAPSIKLSNLDGSSIDLDQYKGKTLFINFWATWCGPCIREMPSIARAKDQLQSSDIEFLFASNEEVESIQKFQKKNGLDLNYVLAGNMEELRIEALPTTMIINARGEVVFSEIGFRQWDSPSNIELITKIINDK